VISPKVMTKKLFVSICHAEKIALLYYPQLVTFGADYDNTEAPNPLSSTKSKVDGRCP
jgi:hypothetical protein